MRSDPFISLTRIGAILVCTGVLVTGGCSSQGFLPDEPDHATSSPAPATDTTVWVPPTPSLVQATTPEPAAPPMTSPAVEEDEPGWNCATMGNRSCGAPNSQQLPVAPNLGAEPAPVPNSAPESVPQQPVDTQHVPHEDEFGPDPAQLCPDGRSECPTGEVIPAPAVEYTPPTEGE